MNRAKEAERYLLFAHQYVESAILMADTPQGKIDDGRLAVIGRLALAIELTNDALERMKEEMRIQVPYPPTDA